MEITIQELLVGFRNAYSRYRVARNETDKVKIFCALFETLNWIVTIDDKLRANNQDWVENYGDSGLIKAVRYTRNRVHHQ
jgi:hypothetical protein